MKNVGAGEKKRKNNGLKHFSLYMDSRGDLVGINRQQPMANSQKLFVPTPSDLPVLSDGCFTEKSK